MFKHFHCLCLFSFFKPTNKSVHARKYNFKVILKKFRIAQITALSNHLCISRKKQTEP